MHATACPFAAIQKYYSCSDSSLPPFHLRAKQSCWPSWQGSGREKAKSACVCPETWSVRQGKRVYTCTIYPAGCRMTQWDFAFQLIPLPVVQIHLYLAWWLLTCTSCHIDSKTKCTLNYLLPLDFCFACSPNLTWVQNSTRTSSTFSNYGVVILNLYVYMYTHIKYIEREWERGCVRTQLIMCSY